MTRAFSNGWRLMALPIAALTIHLAATGFALAQGGSVGGSIGKQGKSASGGSEAAPARPSRPARPARSERSEPRQKNTRTASRGSSSAAKPERASGQSLSGTWRWSGQCQSGAQSYTGTLTISQSGNSFTGAHGGTNMWDNGSISNGRISGNRVSFTRSFAQYHDHLNLALSNNGRSMSGSLSTAHSGQCRMSFSKM